MLRKEVLIGVDEYRAIHESLVRYCRGVDRLDAKLINSAFHPDAVDEHGPYIYSGTSVGPEIVKRLGSENYRATSHMIMNESVELHGDVARTETYFMAAMVEALNEETDRVTFAYGRYIDWFESRVGGWRIGRRVSLLDWASIGEQKRATNIDLPTPWKGQRSREDRSYDEFRSLIER
jgi:hypothetical protein